jgi:hypothetical protein
MTPLTPEQEARELIERAKKLPVEWQEMIAGELMHDRTGDPELKAELTRRWERLRSGQEGTKSIEEVIAGLRRQNEARRA